MAIKDAYPEIFTDVSRVLVVMAHPDDNEIICGGLMARLLADGKQVRLIVMTNGGKGFQNRTDTTEEEFGKRRVQEQLSAGKELGLTADQNFNLGIRDGEVEDTLDNIGKLVFHIRQFKPDLVITHNPFDPINSFDETTKWVNHRDHRKTATLVLDAVYPYSRDRGFFPEHFNKGLSSRTVSKFLFSDSYTYPNVLYFDISASLEKKRAALLKFPNSFPIEEAEALAEETKLSDRYYERLRFEQI